MRTINHLLTRLSEMDTDTWLRIHEATPELDGSEWMESAIILGVVLEAATGSGMYPSLEYSTGWVVGLRRDDKIHYNTGDAAHAVLAAYVAALEQMQEDHTAHYDDGRVDMLDFGDN